MTNNVAENLDVIELERATKYSGRERALYDSPIIFSAEPARFVGNLPAVGDDDRGVRGHPHRIDAKRIEFNEQRVVATAENRRRLIHPARARPDILLAARDHRRRFERV